MSTENSKKVFERKTRKEKSGHVSKMVEVKTDGSEAAVSKAVEKLQKNRSRYFEVHDLETNKKTVYKLAFSGKNYATKVSKL